MAAALFTKSAHMYGATDALAASAGFLDGGRPVHEHVTTLLEQRGIDTSRKRSKKLDATVVEHADLILTMTSEHARGVVSRFPRTITDVYTLRHFGTVVTPRSPETSMRDWLDSINASNRRAYLGDDEAIDIADPIGEGLPVFTELALELESAIDWIMGCAYPTSVTAS